MKSKISFLLLLFISANIYAQNKNYTFTITKGTSGYINDEPNAITILDETVNKMDVLSPWQTIPFEWNFYGKPVNGYFISDNGYITFDSNATISEPVNNNIPSADNVNNAIYSVWDDWNMHWYAWNGDKIKTITKGTSPNRVHIIQWVGVTHAAKDHPYGWGFFAIRLYEGGDFDIVHEAFNGVAALNSSVTVGVENEDGSIATKAMGPDDMVAFGSPSSNSDGSIFRFKWEIQASEDISFDKILIPREVSIGEYKLSGTITNLGFNKVKSFDVVYKIKDTEINAKIDNINILPYESYTFTTPESYKAETPGIFYNVEAWTTNVNEKEDEDSSNNQSLYGKFFGIIGPGASPKQVLLEETTGTWCSPCIGGIIEIDTISSVLENKVNIVAFHGGNDPMANSQSKSFISSYSASFPNGFIDREIYEIRGEKELKIINSLTNHTWFNLAKQQLERWTPLKISFNKNSTYDSNKREINAKIDVNFTDFAIPGDFRIVLYAIEDNVTEIGNPKYSQKNPISGNSHYKWHPYYNLPDPIPDFTFNHVFRGSPSLLGNKGVINYVNFPSDSYSEELTMILDDKWDSNSMSLIAFVYYYDNDNNKRRVLNSCSIHLKDMNITGIEDNKIKNNSIMVYPNPSYSKEVMISFALDFPEDVSVKIIDQLGNNVFIQDVGNLQTGTNNIPLNLKSLPKGIYYILVSSSKHKNMINKIVLLE